MDNYTSISKNENKNDRFKRVASRRTERVLEALRVLGNCANRGAYHYSDDEINKICSAIDEQLRLVKAKFKSPKRKKEFKF